MKSRRILVITEDPYLRALCKQTLRAAGYSVHTTGEGVQALRRARKTPYDIVLIDPPPATRDGMAQFESLQTVLPGVIGVLFTELSDVGTAVAALRSGISDIVRKPCDVHDLLTVVERRAEQAMAQREYRRLKAQEPFVAEIRRRADELAMLLEASLTFSASLDPDRIVRLLAVEITKAVGATFSRVWLLNSEDDTLTVRAAYSLRELRWDPGIGRRVALADVPYHRRVVETRNPVVFRQDIPQIALSGQELDMTFTPDTKSGALFPMAIGERVVGVVTLGECRRWERIPRGVERLRVCGDLAYRASSALENARLYKALEEKEQSLQQAVDELSRHQREDEIAEIGVPA